MAIVVVGGHSRSLGKTSVVAGLISALPERRWTALKITQYGHGICSANGKPCDCVTADHSMAVSEEKSRAGDTDTSRFLAAGAERVYWVRTQQGFLAEVMPRLRQILQSSNDVIIESNSVMRFLRPNLYLVLLDYGVDDFKPSAQLFLDQASALLVNELHGEPCWQGVSLKPVAGRPMFPIRPPQYVTPEVVAFVRQGLATASEAAARAALSPHR